MIFKRTGLAQTDYKATVAIAEKQSMQQVGSVTINVA
jgi:hypothetical protein